MSSRKSIVPSLLSSDALVKELCQFGVDTSTATLALEGEAEQLQIVYEKALVELTGIQREVLAPSVFGEEHDVMYECALQQELGMRVKLLLQNLGVHSFTQKDIAAPDPQRTRKFLTVLQNFRKFRRDMAPYKDGLDADLQTLRDTTAHLDASCNEVRAERDEVKGALALRNTDTQERQARLQEQASQCQAVQRQHDAERSHLMAAENLKAQAKDEKKQWQTKQETLAHQVTDTDCQIAEDHLPFQQGSSEVNMALDKISQECSEIKQDLLEHDTGISAAYAAARQANELASFATEHIEPAQQQLEELQQSRRACEKEEQPLAAHIAEAKAQINAVLALIKTQTEDNECLSMKHAGNVQQEQDDVSTAKAKSAALTQQAIYLKQKVDVQRAKSERERQDIMDMKEARTALMQELNLVQDNMKRSITEHDEAFSFLVAAAQDVAARRAACDEQGQRVAQMCKALGYSHAAATLPRASC